MRDNDRQLGKPMRVYRDTKANIEALTLGAADEGCEAYATDINKYGRFSGELWAWDRFYNVRAFGAVPDGATRADDKIQDAIDTAFGEGGGCVHAPVAGLGAKFYKMEAPLDWKPGVSIWGDSAGIVNIGGTNYRGSLFRAHGKFPIIRNWQAGAGEPPNYCSLKNLILEYDNLAGIWGGYSLPAPGAVDPATTPVGIFIGAANVPHGLIFENVRVINAGYGLFMEGGSFLNSFNRLDVSNCRVGIYCEGSAAGFWGCEVNGLGDTSRDGLPDDPPWDKQAWVLIGNNYVLDYCDAEDFLSSTNPVIDIRDCLQLTIDGFSVENIDFAGDSLMRLQDLSNATIGGLMFVDGSNTMQAGGTRYLFVNDSKVLLSGLRVGYDTFPGGATRYGLYIEGSRVVVRASSIDDQSQGNVYAVGIVGEPAEGVTLRFEASTWASLYDPKGCKQPAIWRGHTFPVVDYVHAYLEPYGESHASARTQLGVSKYLADRDVSYDHVFAAWDGANGLYGRIGFSAWMGSDSSMGGAEDAPTLNAIYNARYAAGEIYHLFFHPMYVDWTPGNYATLHLDHIKEHNDVWYVGFGALYLYHYVDERNIVAVAAGGVGEFDLSVSTANHDDYGLTYPVTYTFSIPAALVAGKAFYRYSQEDAWVQLPNKTPADFFNGINAVRFDFVNDVVHASIAFGDTSDGATSDHIYLKFTDGADAPIVCAFVSIPPYYDDRVCAVTLTADDWWSVTGSDAAFQSACNACQARSIWITVGVVTTQGGGPNWSLIQTELDQGHVEVASHSRTHSHIGNAGVGPNADAYDFEGEIDGSKLDIQCSLTLSSLYIIGTEREEEADIFYLDPQEKPYYRDSAAWKEIDAAEETIVCRVIRDTAGQPINNGVPVALEWNTILTSTDFNFSGSDPTKIYVRTPGYYVAGGGVSLDTCAAAYRLGLAVQANIDGALHQIGTTTLHTIANKGMRVSVSSAPVWMDKDDYFQIEVTQDSGAQRTAGPVTAITNEDIHCGWLMRVR